MTSRTLESIDDSLDREIAELQSQVEGVTKALQLHTTALLTSHHVTAALADASLASSASSNSSYSSANSQHTTIPHALVDRLRARATRQGAHAQRCMYRLAGGGVTAFRVRDPDPNAVDNGRVLGLRFEVMSRSRFWRTYFVLLNRPYVEEGQKKQRDDREQGGPNHDEGAPRTRTGRAAFLRVHRHTIPGCISVGGLAARYLPSATLSDGECQDLAHGPGTRRRRPQQDLISFARALRRELVAYHNRLGVVADTKRAAEAAANSGQEMNASNLIVDIRTADAEAKQVHVEWADGKTGRVLIDDGGAIGKAVVFGHQGREWAASLDAMPHDKLKAGEAREVEGLLARLGVSIAD